MDKVLVTICARGGSKGVKGKNIRDLAGHPLIYYTIRQATNWGKATRIVVSTDSDQIAQIAVKCGAEVPFIRPSKLATDTAPKGYVIRHALVSSEIIYSEKYDVVMDLDVTSPIRKVDDLENAYKIFLKEKPKTLFSVVRARRNPYFNMVELNKDKRVTLVKQDRNITCRQEAPPVYDMNASIYIYDRDFLWSDTVGSPFTNNTVVYEMDDLSAIDIDTEADFKYIEYLVKEKIVKL